MPAAMTPPASPGRLVVIGAGGHAKVAIDTLRLVAWTVVGCTDPDPPPAVLDVPLLGGDEMLGRLRRDGVSAAFVALGDNALRQRIGLRLVDQYGYDLPAAIHPSATVSRYAKIGRGVAVFAGAVINADATIGDFAIVNTGATIDHDCMIGSGAHVAPNCALAGGVSVGERGFLGVGCCVIPGIAIGEDAVLGAGSVVVRDLPAGSRAFGNPARPVT